ncbi:hypothetical protein LJR225_002752 [Phenylobacterium sp. LjRoot225]
MLLTGDRLPRAVGHAVNAAISLMIWHGIAVASVGLLQWGNTLAG